MPKRFFVYEDLIGFNHDEPYFDSIEDAIKDIKDTADDCANDYGCYDRLHKLDPNRATWYNDQKWMVEDTVTGDIVYQAYILVEYVKDKPPIVSYEVITDK
jgi:hypothetical protein